MARPDQVFHLREAEKELGFAQAVRSSGRLFVSGTCSLDLDSNVIAANDMRGQMTQIYRLIQTSLEAHDLTFQNIVKETIFVTDIEAFREALPVRAEFYANAAPPAATWIEVSRLMRPQFLIEIEVTVEAS